MPQRDRRLPDAADAAEHGDPAVQQHRIGRRVVRRLLALLGHPAPQYGRGQLWLDVVQCEHAERRLGAQRLVDRCAAAQRVDDHSILGLALQSLAFGLGGAPDLSTMDSESVQCLVVEDAHSAPPIVEVAAAGAGLQRAQRPAQQSSPSSAGITASWSRARASGSSTGD